MRSTMILILTVLATACSYNAGRPLPYEVIEEPVAFYFDTDPRNQTRVGALAEKLEPHFPEMSWRIGTYDPAETDGLVVVVEERTLRDPFPEGRECSDCTRIVTAFVIFDRGTRLGIEEFEDCTIYRMDGDCFSVRRLVSSIDTLVADARSGPPRIRI